MKLKDCVGKAIYLNGEIYLVATAQGHLTKIIDDENNVVLAYNDVIGERGTLIDPESLMTTTEDGWDTLDGTRLMDLGNGCTFRYKGCVFRVVRKNGLDVVVNKIIDEAGMYVDGANEVLNGCVCLKYTVDRGLEVLG